MVVVLFLGAVQLVGIGLLGEYLGRIFVETKVRPLYLLDEIKHAGIVLPIQPGDNQPTDIAAPGASPVLVTACGIHS